MKLLIAIYSYLVAPLLFLIMKFLSLFNKKIREGLKGRKKLLENLILKLNECDATNKQIICFHASSMGEFEQAKPIIEELKKRKDNCLIAATFFSPSGYKNNLNYGYVDIISYAPIDLPTQTKSFAKILKPDIFVFMRYDIWPNLIFSLKKNNCRLYLVDATMKSNSKRLRPLVKEFHKYLFEQFERILTISEKDKNNFLKFGISNDKIEAVGDTRFDRVYNKSLTAREKKILNEELFKDKMVIVAGSVWDEDNNIILPVIKKLNKYHSNIILILVPHEPTERNLEYLERKLEKDFSFIRFSQMLSYKNEKVIIIDSVGILLTLYKYANIAFVGGGFKYNVHNVLEPAAYGIPVLYGPKIKKSQEAEKLAELGGGFIVENQRQAYKILKELICNPTFRENASKISKQFILNNIGATERILHNLNF